MQTIITSSGLITNEYPGLSINPHECHDFIHNTKYTEILIKRHIEWYVEGSLPYGLEVDILTGIISGKIYPLHKQPDCLNQLPPKEPMKVDGSNRDRSGLYPNPSHTFNFNIYRRYMRYEDIFDFIENTNDTTRAYKIGDRVQNMYTYYVYECVCDTPVTTPDITPVEPTEGSTTNPPPDPTPVITSVSLLDINYFIDITEVEEIAESNLSIMVIKSGNIANTIFMESIVNTEDVELNNLIIDLNGGLGLEVVIDRAHITFNGNKYYKEDLDRLYQEHPGPFSTCPITD